jgi:hypothetical protein
MNNQANVAVLQPRLHSSLATPGVDQAAALLHRLFLRFDGHLALRLWEGTLLKLGRAAHREKSPQTSTSRRTGCRFPRVKARAT